jgi:transposase
MRRDRPAQRMFGGMGYDPARDLAADHLARLVDLVVEEAVPAQGEPTGPGQPSYPPRLYAKVLIYGYATGERSSRRLEQCCRESLPYLFLTRGEHPSYRSLCRFRVAGEAVLEAAWLQLFAVAARLELPRVGRVVVDTSKLRANTSQELVLTAAEYGPVKEALVQALAEAEAIDAREEQHGGPPPTRTGKDLGRAQMRDLVREVRAKLAGKPAAPAPKAMSRRMRRRMEQAIGTLEEAREDGRTHLSLTDPEAQMMHGGREKQVRESYSFEAAIEQGAGLLVAAGVTREGTDSRRLEPLLEQARPQLPGGKLEAVDGDSGFYHTNVIRDLLEAGVDVCVPDTKTAGMLHRGQWREPAVLMVYESEQDQYRCPEGKVLAAVGTFLGNRGYEVTHYRVQESCRECVQAEACFSQQAQRREYKTLQRRTEPEALEAHLARFREPQLQARYRRRGGWIEGVFGYIKGGLGFGRWLLRGERKVAQEGRLMALSYQLKRVHRAWAAQAAG